MKEKLSDFIAQNAKTAELAAQAKTMIAAFEKAADEGFHLVQTADLNEPEIVEIISLISNRPVEKIVPVSAADPRFIVRDGEVTSDLIRDTEESLWERLYSRNHHTLWEELGRDRGNKLMCLLEDGLAKLVDELVSGCLERVGGYDLRRTIQRHLYHPLAYFIGLAMTGNAERMFRIEPVLRLMLQGIIPVAEKKGAPRTWYVLTA